MVNPLAHQLKGDQTWLRVGAVLIEHRSCHNWRFFDACMRMSPRVNKRTRDDSWLSIINPRSDRNMNSDHIRPLISVRLSLCRRTGCRSAAASAQPKRVKKPTISRAQRSAGTAGWAGTPVRPAPTRSPLSPSHGLEPVSVAVHSVLCLRQCGLIQPAMAQDQAAQSIPLAVLRAADLFL